MIQGILGSVMTYKTAIIIGAVVLVTTNAATGLVAYNKGVTSERVKTIEASQKALQASAKANSKALAREMDAVTKRVKKHTEIKSAIEGSHDKTDNDPAPPAFQLVFDRLRIKG